MTASRMGTESLMQPSLGKCTRHVVYRSGVKYVSIVEVESAELGIAKACCICENCLEHWLKLVRRVRDDPQHLRGRGFALARFGELAGELLDICFLVGTEGTATACSFWRIAALQRLGASRFYCFAARFITPIHACPEAKDKASYRLRRVL